MEQIDAAEEMSALNDVRVAVLGKKGELTAVLKSMKDVKPEDRPAVGQLVNETRSAIEEKLAEAKERMEEAELDHRLKSEVIDVTLPAKKAKDRTFTSKHQCIAGSRRYFRWYGL